MNEHQDDVSKYRIESVAVVGAGAMGGMYAAHFARAGFTVAFVATGERARRLRATPLTVNDEPLAAGVVDPAGPFDPRFAPADLVLVAVKAAQLPEAMDQLAPLVGERTIIMSILNGLDSEAELARRFGAEKVPLVVALGMDAQRDGHAVRYRQAGRLEIGDAPGALHAGGKPSPQLNALAGALTRAGVRWHLSEDIVHTMWWKFMANVGMNQASAVLRVPYGAFCADGPARSLMFALQAEVIDVANAEGIRLGPDDLASWDAVLARQPPAGWTSMLQDVVAGRPTEVAIFAGRVISLGEKHGIPTPYNQAIAWILAGAGTAGTGAPAA